MQLVIIRHRYQGVYSIQGSCIDGLAGRPRALIGESLDGIEARGRGGSRVSKRSLSDSLLSGVGRLGSFSNKSRVFLSR